MDVRGSIVRPKLRVEVLDAIAVAAGTILVQTLAALPPPILDAGLALVALAAFTRPQLRRPAIAVAAFAMCAWRAELALDARLAPEFESRDLDVVATVDELPRVLAGIAHASLRVERAALVDAADTPIALNGSIRVSWYSAPADAFAPCTRWRLRVRLKRPRGLVDPGGFDFERHALERGIVATGYVRAEGPHEAIDRRAFCVDGLRGRLAAEIDRRVADPHDAALIRAFAIGDTRALDGDDWSVARTTGIPHLLAISGFHVGVAAALGVLVIRVLWWLLPSLALRCPRALAEAPAALAAATFYAMLAGGSLPTLRTLVMIAIVALARVARRAASGPQSLALAFVAITVLDPLSVLSPGFWLSFVGVAFLMLTLERGHGWRGFVRELTLGQIVMSVALLPLSIAFFGEASIVGVFANLVAVPIVSFAIVPLCLASLIALLLAPSLAMPFLDFAAASAHIQWKLLELAAALPGAHAYLPESDILAFVMALIGAAWLVAARGAPARIPAAALLLPLLFPAREIPVPGAFEATVIDVGQGLAVLVRTHAHAMLYDAGPRFPSGFDLGSAAVVPTLHALGVRRLDALVVSHSDNDHAGGARAVLREFPAPLRLGGEPERTPVPLASCRRGIAWTWDRVRFTVVSADAVASTADRSDNDRSCVLLVEGEGGRLLLPGDITRRVEGEIAVRVGAGAPLAIVVPHHGSRSSSGEAFVAALKPELALVSSGWHNHFGHPAPEIVARYRAVGAALHDTGREGALRIRFPADRPPSVEAERSRRPRYWREPAGA